MFLVVLEDKDAEAAPARVAVAVEYRMRDGRDGVCRSILLPSVSCQAASFLLELGTPCNKILKILLSLDGTPPAGSSGSILKLHEDVQTCGYRDVQVMFDILTSELEASTQRPAVKNQHQQQQRKRRPQWPSHRSSSVIAAAQ
jgi:hypothetical protein